MSARIIRPKTVPLCPGVAMGSCDARTCSSLPVLDDARGALQLNGLIHFAQPWIERARTDRTAVAAQFSHHG